jgi:hypothetical protein
MRASIASACSIGLLVLVAACSRPAASARPPSASPGTPAPAETKSANAGGATRAPEATRAPGASSTPVATTRTSWGVIVDVVPATFPVFPDATVADPPAGPVSGAWVSNASVAEISTWYRDALTAAGFDPVDLSAPLEDGSRVVDARGKAAACAAQVTVRPAGGSTMITVLDGAGCAAPGG